MLNYLSVISYANGSKDPLSGTRTLSQALVRVETVLREDHDFVQLNRSIIVTRGARPLSPTDKESDEWTGSFTDINFLHETICHYLGIMAFLGDKHASQQLGMFGLNSYTFNLHRPQVKALALNSYSAFKAALALAACLSLSDQRVQRLLEQATAEVIAVTTLYAEGENTLEEILELLTT